GAHSVQRLLDARRVRQVRRADMERLGTAGRKALDFVHLPDHRPGAVPLAPLARPRSRSPAVGEQPDLFGWAEAPAAA
ncbi:MAG: hypothetical protein ACT7A5_35170, partial [Ferrovibrionaceae bacterium]